MDLGFAEAGFDLTWANDIDPLACETYRTNIAPHITCGDLLRQDLPAAGSIDVVIGGPPCQGFSVAGKMDPSDPRSRHIWNFLGVVRRLDPSAFVMENVKGLAENRRWEDVRSGLIAAADEMGYSTRLIVLNSSHFGVPQSRERMFLIGLKGRYIDDPVPTSLAAAPTVGDIIRGMPAAGLRGNATRCAAKITTATKPVLRRSAYAGMLFNGQGRPLHPNRPASTLPASMGGNRTPIIDEMKVHNPGIVSWVEWYHGHLMAGGSPVPDVPSHLRRLTVEEAAAMQTFPRDFHFSGPQSAQYRQIGNAVPPRLAYHVALALRKAMGGSGTGLATVA
jgi:DNA (cytosine-5)-methyltransferase 1